MWAKNGMVALPLLMSINDLCLPLSYRVMLAFVAFCCFSSAGYIVNDLVDLPNDRAHPVKRHRPLASGEISVREAMLLMVALLAAGIWFGGSLSLAVCLVLSAYFALSLIYSGFAKSFVALDVVFLVVLHMLRIVIGFLAIDVAISKGEQIVWLVISTLFLASLALSKRCHEWRQVVSAGFEHLPGRGYRKEHMPWLQAAGLALAALAVTTGFVTAAKGLLDVIWALALAAIVVYSWWSSLFSRADQEFVQVFLSGFTGGLFTRRTVSEGPIESRGAQ